MLSNLSYFVELWNGDRIACNDHGLLLCWRFITVSPELKPSEKLMMKLTTKGEMNSVCMILADSSTIADCYSLRQHGSKPNVSGRRF